MTSRRAAGGNYIIPSGSTTASLTQIIGMSQTQVSARQVGGATITTDLHRKIGVCTDRKTGGVSVGKVSACRATGAAIKTGKARAYRMSRTSIGTTGRVHVWWMGRATNKVDIRKVGLRIMK